MHKTWHIAYIGIVMILIGVVLLREYQHRDRMNAFRDLDDAYRRSIRYAGAWLAERQNDIGHATYLYKGIEMLDPDPIGGHPVCQLGCVYSSERVVGIDVNAEAELITGYNQKLEGLNKEEGPNQASQATSLRAEPER